MHLKNPFEMDLNNETKLQLYQQQIQLQKQLKNKKDLLSALRRSYFKNKTIAQEQIDLIKQLTQIQNAYYEKISIPPPIPDSNTIQYNQYRYLINDLDKSYNKDGKDSELAFPFDEEISPSADKYSSLYKQLDEWLQKKEKLIEEDEQNKNLKAEIEKLKIQNSQLKNQIESEPDRSDQIIEIKKIIKEKKLLLSSKDEINSQYQQIMRECDLLKKIDSSNKETNDESNYEDLKINKEVNVNSLNKLQLECLKKFEENRNCRIERKIQEYKFRELIKEMNS